MYFDFEGIMLDIETLGTRPGCSILSIGACEFSMKGIGKQFYASIDPSSCVEWGLHIEPRTVLWWMDQSQDARDFITKGQHTALDIALADLVSAFKWKGKELWANGSDFDFPIITSAFDAVGKNLPWEYWAKNDYRTIKKLLPRQEYQNLRVEPTVKHNALADAVAQAETLIAVGKYLNAKIGVRRAA